MAKKQQMSYKEMADYIKNCGYHMTRWDVVSWLIGRLRSEIWWWVKEGLTCLMAFGVMGAMTVLMLMMGGR